MSETDSKDVSEELNKKIVRQVEYYFGDINLPRDKFLQEKIKEDEGWVTLEVLLTFKRLASLSSDPEVIANAIEKSENKIIEVSEDKKKVRRNPSLQVPEFNEERRKVLIKRTAYAKGFPLDENLNDILNFLEPYGPIESCIRRTNKEKEHKFKGSCFVVFKDAETCKKFVEAEDVKYKDVELIRKWQEDYYNDKKKEIEERKGKKAKKQIENAKLHKPVEFPKGSVIHFSGLSEEQKLTREEIKEKILELVKFEVSFINYTKGDTEGYVRFAKENNAVDFAKTLTDGELEIGDTKLKVRVLEGEEEETFLKKSSDDLIRIRQKQKSQKGGGRKRKGAYGDRQNKRRKAENVD